MNNLPWFKFDPSQWLTGSIAFERKSIKGAFIDLMCYYWSKKCEMTIAQAKQVTGREWKELLRSGVVKVDNDIVRIDALKNQYDKMLIDYERAVANGRKGGLAKAKKTKKITYDNNNLLKVQPEVLKLLGNDK